MARPRGHLGNTSGIRTCRRGQSRCRARRAAVETKCRPRHPGCRSGNDSSGTPKPRYRGDQAANGGSCAASKSGSTGDDETTSVVVRIEPLEARRSSRCHKPCAAADRRNRRSSATIESTLTSTRGAGSSPARHSVPADPGRKGSGHESRDERPLHGLRAREVRHHRRRTADGLSATVEAEYRPG